MSFFDKLSETVSSKSKDIANKAKEIAEISSINGQISEKEEVIERTLLEIGKKFYDENKEDANEAYEELFSIINVSKQEIEQLQIDIMNLKGVKVCPECEGEVDLKATFCSSCGHKFEVVESVEQVKVCSSCKTELEADAAFCGNCGTKVEATEE